jgi:hypothetical protein
VPQAMVMPSLQELSPTQLMVTSVAVRPRIMTVSEQVFLASQRM